MDFNITHTNQQVFCAIMRNESEEIALYDLRSRRHYPNYSVSDAQKQELFRGKNRVGIDAENLSRIATMRICPLAERWFSEREMDFFLHDPTDRTFLRIWTRKEALVKWLGTGFSGLRDADTTTAESMYGVRFWEYEAGDAVLSICIAADVRPAKDICMLSNDDVEEFFGL